MGKGVILERCMVGHGNKLHQRFFHNFAGLRKIYLPETHVTIRSTFSEVESVPIGFLVSSPTRASYNLN